MTIIFRQKKGAPLTAEEVDGNFQELLSRIEALESMKPLHESLAQIQTEGDELIFQGTLGSELGRARLPTVRFVPKGSWKEGLSYDVNDLISRENTTYICQKNHTSKQFEADIEAWVKLFEVEKESPQETQPSIPLLLKKQLPPSTFGAVVVMIDDDNIELLIGDAECWRRVRDMQPVKTTA